MKKWKMSSNEEKKKPSMVETKIKCNDDVIWSGSLSIFITPWSGNRLKSSGTKEDIKKFNCISDQNIFI